MDFGFVKGRLPDRDGLVAALDRIPAAAGAASPFVPGESVDAAVETVEQLAASGIQASVLYLPAADAPGTARLANVHLIEGLAAAGLAEGNDLAVKLAHFGLHRGAPWDGVRADVQTACEAAAGAGMTVTIAGVPHAGSDDALRIRADLAASFPDLGMTISANLHRSEGDVLDLAQAGARVRLIRRESPENIRIAFQPPHEIDKAYVRCLRMGIDAGARIVLATHDARLQEIGAAIAERSESEVDLAYQFALGVQPEKAEKLHASGARVSVLVPWGPGWANYVTRRIPLTPAAVGQMARALSKRDSTVDPD